MKKLSGSEAGGSILAMNPDKLADVAPSLLDALPGMAYRRINDGNWSLIHVSNGCHGLLGYKPEEMLAEGKQGFGNYIHPSYVKQFEDMATQTGRSRTSFAMAYLTNHKKGWDKWVWDVASCVYSSAGKLLYMDGYVTDCSGMSKIEEAIKVQHSEFKEYAKGFRFGKMIGRSPAMQKVFKTILKVAESGTNTILYGESGTGKELAAREIHNVGNRADKPFVPVNCGAIPENLMESELFGYRKGAFSGADKDKLGLLEVADGGTLFLDEIGEIPLSMQVKLLRALEGDGFTPMGGCEVVRPDLTIVAATNRNLAAMVAGGQIRSDFYYRVNVIPIHIPPLRERREDIQLLIGAFMAENNRRDSVPGNCLQTIFKYDWPGNVRELKNQVRHFVTLGSFDLPIMAGCKDGETCDEAGSFKGSLQERVAQVEASIIRRELTANQWNRTRTAQVLGVDRRTLFTKIKKYGLETSGPQ